MRRIILAALLAAAALPAMAQDVGQTIDVGGWKIRRVQGEGKIQTCVALQPADDKTGVGFGATNQDQGFLMLIDNDGKMKPGTQIVLEYKIDSGATAKVSATAVNPNTLIAALGTIQDVSPFFTAVESGNGIHLETPDSTFDYSLRGSKAALAALGACLQASMTP